MWFEGRNIMPKYKEPNISDTPKDKVIFLKQDYTCIATESLTSKTHDDLIVEDDDFDLFGVSMD